MDVTPILENLNEAQREAVEALRDARREAQEGVQPVVAHRLLGQHRYRVVRDLGEAAGHGEGLARPVGADHGQDAGAQRGDHRRLGLFRQLC